MNSYRKLKKRYERMFGWTVHISLTDKEGKYMRKASKRVTAICMRKDLHRHQTIIGV